MPAPIRLPNNDIWCYVKGVSSIYAYSSSDGESFTLENGAAPVLDVSGAGWDSQFAVEPAAFIEGSTIHIYYKGTDDPTGVNNWAWGHATAPTSDPTNITKNAGNPILTGATVATDLGATTVTDLALSDVVKIGSTYHFWGYARVDNRYQIIHATGNAVDNPSNVTSVITASSDDRIVQSPSVFQSGADFIMSYSRGLVARTPAPSREVAAAISPDGVTGWNANVNPLIVAGAGWEAQRVFVASVLKDNLTPILIADDWYLYYSGSNAGGTEDAVGLARLQLI